MSAKNNLKVRRATRKDIAAILRIEKASFGHDAWERDWSLDYLSEPETVIFLVAARGNTIAGYALAVHNQTPHRTRLNRSGAIVSSSWCRGLADESAGHSLAAASRIRHVPDGPAG
jgi:ribosomal protein S18 acetylase RimI-like enzyme